MLNGVPFPPTVNQLYAGKSIRYKSDKAKAYDTEVDLWYLKNIKTVKAIRTKLRPYKFADHTFLSFKLDFLVPYETLYSKQGKLKKIDVSNRVKALLDKLSELFDVDDNRFFLKNVEFCIGNTKCVNIEITDTMIRTVNNGDG